jgi:uncharacterized protein YkwD
MINSEVPPPSISVKERVKSLNDATRTTGSAQFPSQSTVSSKTTTKKAAPRKGGASVYAQAKAKTQTKTQAQAHSSPLGKRPIRDVKNWPAEQTSTKQSFSEQIGSEIENTINGIRKKAGLEPLTISTSLSQEAKRHSQNIVSELRLSHNINGGVEDRVPSDNFGLACENIASYPSSIIQSETPKYLAKQIVDNWMESDGHRQNIFRQETRSYGIGIKIIKPDNLVPISDEDWQSGQKPKSQGKGFNQLIVTMIFTEKSGVVS